MPKTPKSEQPRRFDRRSMEQLSAKISKLMREKNFSSMDEANEFIRNNVIGAPIDDLAYEPETPLEQAQSIMWQAFDEPSQKKRIALAKKALSVCPDCADAYVLLAEDDAHKTTEAMQLYRQGVDAGRRALGDEIFSDSDHPFWSDHSTRPYMRALNGLACSLQEDGQVDEAIQHWTQLLKLNPNDNQGVRWLLVPALIEAERLDEAEAVLRQFDNDVSAHLLYSRALLLFKKQGDSPAAVDALEEAIATNKHVMEVLCGLRKMPKNRAESYSIGSPEEAFEYIRDGIESWINTDGALDWIAAYIQRGLERVRLAEVFPGLTPADAQPESNVLDLSTFRSR